MADLNTPPVTYLDPEDQAFADELSTVTIPSVQEIHKFRKFLDQLQKHTPIPGVKVEEIAVPFGDDVKDAVKTFIYRPEDASGDLPVIFWFHGGGWVSGNHFIYDSLSREIALRSGCAVVFPEYSLAPEKKFPVQNEECFTVVKYFAKKGKAHNLRTDKFAFGGDSAGGQLSPAVINLIHDRKLEKSIKVVFQMLFNPVTILTDLNLDRQPTLSEFEEFNAPLLPVSIIKDFANNYITNPKDRQSILASPLLMNKDQASLQPPTMISVSSIDPLRTEGEQFAKLLQTSGVQCGLVRAEAQIHDTVLLEATRKGPTAHSLILMASALFSEALRSADPADKTGEKRKRTTRSSEPEWTKKSRTA
ncbi:Alpha/Beta hydrolase protein [Xylogone sp. PMI_703]|nr:Alpha/Beta hydrolase protein [Xylogone sp. PMI_703]